MTRVIEMDARNWRSDRDFYEALAASLGSFEGHGRNADAFLETMIYLPELNRQQPPYEVRISNATEDMRAFLGEFASWVAEARHNFAADPDGGEDVPVSVVIE